MESEIELESGRPTGAYRETHRGEGETQPEVGGGAKIDENKVFF